MLSEYAKARELIDAHRRETVDARARQDAARVRGVVARVAANEESALRLPKIQSDIDVVLQEANRELLDNQGRISPWENISRTRSHELSNRKYNEINGVKTALVVPGLGPSKSLEVKIIVLIADNNVFIDGFNYKPYEDNDFVFEGSKTLDLSQYDREKENFLIRFRRIIINDVVYICTSIS